MNKEQRKYLRERLQGVTNVKRTAITEAHQVPPAFKDDSAKLAYVTKALKSVKEIASVEGSRYAIGYILTDKEAERNKKQAAEDEVIAKKYAELKELSKDIEDKIVLGDDAEEITAMLQQIKNFKI